MGSTLSIFSQLISNPSSMKNPRSQTSNEELEQLYKLMKAYECKLMKARECKENQTTQQLQELNQLMEHWYKLEKNTRRQTAQHMLEHFYKLGKARESEETRLQIPKEWEPEIERTWHWYKQIAVSECNEKLLLFAMKCGWLAVNNTTEEITKRKLDVLKCISVAFSFYRCLKKLDKKYGEMDIPIDDFKEP